MKGIFVFCTAVFITTATFPQLTFRITAAKEIQNTLPGKGRMLLYFHSKDRPEPMHSIVYEDVKTSGFRFARDVIWDSREPLLLSDGLSGFPKTSLQQVEAGDYYIQVLYDTDTTSYRLFIPPNSYSTKKKIRIDGKGKQVIDLKLDKLFKPAQYKDDRYVKYISVKSELLTKFWKRDIFIRAAVMVPVNYDSTGTKKYPVCYQIGGYGTSCTSLQRNDSISLAQWISGDSPEMLFVLLDSDAPYGDSYQMNSENNGPYMDALIQELIPEIETKFNAYSSPGSRFLTGGSTGGWVSLALQIFNPDFFNGCWSFYSDPVDFHFFQLVNIYDDDNAFINRFGNINPSMRTVYDEPMLSIKDEVYHENLNARNGSYIFSGGQWGGWNAVYSPRGIDGYSKPIWDPVSGKIDREVAEHWKRWDLNLYLRQNWDALGPRLQGKLNIWMGDMDTYYLNNAMRLMEEFLSKTENPKSDARFIFGPMQVHGWEPLTRSEMLKQMRRKFDDIKKGF